MSLTGLLMVIGIIIAKYALAQPIQRKSIHIFVPIWLIILLIIISVIVLIWRYVVPILGYIFYSWSDLASTFSVFLLPIVSAIIAVYFWYRAKLTTKKDEKFRKFIIICLYENKFGELIRILVKIKNQWQAF